MDWLFHPRFARERARTIEVLKRKKYHFRRVKKIVFLCGGYRSPRREDLRKYFERFVEDSLIFYAEAVWAVIATDIGTANALEVEERLASLADICIIVVESPGTFAELGAFAMSEPLRRKLLPILDDTHKGTDSFLVTGPVRWVDAESTFGPSIWTDLDKLLVAAKEIEERLGRLGKTLPVHVDDLLESPKHLLFFVCDLVSVFGPCPIAHVSAAINDIWGATASSVDTSFLLGLGKAMGLLGSFDFAKTEMFYRKLRDGRLIPFQRKGHIDLATLRTQMMGAMVGCGLCDGLLAAYAHQQ